MACALASAAPIGRRARAVAIHQFRERHDSGATRDTRYAQAGVRGRRLGVHRRKRWWRRGPIAEAEQEILERKRLEPSAAAGPRLGSSTTYRVPPPCRTAPLRGYLGAAGIGLTDIPNCLESRSRSPRRSHHPGGAIIWAYLSSRLRKRISAGNDHKWRTNLRATNQARNPALTQPNAMQRITSKTGDARLRQLHRREEAHPYRARE